LLLARGDKDLCRAAALLSEADGLAHQIGLKALRGRITALGAPIASVSFPGELSAREAQILRLVAHGLTNRDIGASLFISKHTAAKHVSHILTKTGCANRTEASSYAHRHGLVDE
jgi:DNA-binding NarL/FixJ family response regulator